MSKKTKTMEKSEEVVENTASEAKEIAKTVPGGVPVSSINWEAEAGAGMENVGMADKTIPFIKICQAISPEVTPGHEKFVEGLGQGNIFNSANNHIWKEGITVIPCFFEKRYTLWKSRKDGGGLVADLGTDRTKFDQASRDPNGTPLTPEGFEVLESNTYHVLIVDDKGDVEQAVIGMAKTQTKKSKKWLRMLGDIKLPRASGVGKFTPPIFYSAWKLTTQLEKNQKGNWYGWVLQSLGPTCNLPNGEALVTAAHELNQLCRAGLVKVAAEGMNDGDEGGEDEAAVNY